MISGADDCDTDYYALAATERLMACGLSVPDSQIASPDTCLGAAQVLARFEKYCECPEVCRYQSSGVSWCERYTCDTSVCGTDDCQSAGDALHDNLAVMASTGFPACSADQYLSGYTTYGEFLASEPMYADDRLRMCGLDYGTDAVSETVSAAGVLRPSLQPLSRR